jgi:release factor glutamine methyltransferase
VLSYCAGGDQARLEALVQRRLAGEPLAWITGRTEFCGLELEVDRGVYVPRWQSEPLARLAAQRLPVQGTAIDLCTGSGAIARVLMTRRPAARVVASDIDEGAVACARRNGVDAYQGDLFGPLPAGLEGDTDVVVAVVPYVPTAELPLLQRDTLKFESPLAYDGGGDGTEILRVVIRESRHFLRAGGKLLLEIGGHQDQSLRGDLERLGYRKVTLLHDEEGDLRGLEATLT